MKMSDIQIAAVKKWLADGCDVAQVQKSLLEEFDVSMTYMDVRFLIDDLGEELHVPEKKQVAPIVQDNAVASDSEETSSVLEDDSGVHVAMSPQPREGAYLSGSVIFSDGGVAEWLIDQNGQLGLIPETQGYNAPATDIPIFQKKLQDLISSEADRQKTIEDSDLQNTPNDPNKKEVVVSMSKIQRPDCLAFGDVVFSDGSKAEWRIDRMGQLGLIPEQQGHQPPNGDMVEFQQKLQDLLKSMF